MSVAQAPGAGAGIIRRRESVLGLEQKSVSTPTFGSTLP
jgi:hypothetical protein